MLLPEYTQLLLKKLIFTLSFYNFFNNDNFSIKLFLLCSSNIFAKI